MNVQEKMTMLKCCAHQKRESQGAEGKEAGILEDWIDEDTLAGEVTPEEIDQARRLSEYEIMYFNDEPFLVPPEAQEELLQWLRDLTQSSKLTAETKERISEAFRLLKQEWRK